MRDLRLARAQKLSCWIWRNPSIQNKTYVVKAALVDNCQGAHEWVKGGYGVLGESGEGGETLRVFIAKQVNLMKVRIN